MSLRDSVGDAFVTLPLLLLGFLFFIGTLTSNTGILLLCIGQLALVPTLGFLANDRGTPFHTTGPDGNTSFDLIKALRTAVACVVFYAVHSTAISSMEGISGWGFMITPAIVIILQYCVRYFAEVNVSHFDIFNPANLFGIESKKPSESRSCSIIPNSKGEIYNRPSDWVNTVVFFFGFVITNAVAVYSEPSPQVSTQGTDQQIKERQARTDARVANRKFLTACIIAVSVIVLLILLAFRYNKSDCEETMYLAFVPVLIAGLTGSAWFQFIYKACGVRPTDILGIVQGMAPSQLIDSPIVCMGS